MTEVVQVQATGAASFHVQSVARKIGGEIAKFGTVGAAAFVLDVGLFNVLRASVLSDSPLTAKTISVVVATTFAFLANRHWTYRDRARTGYGRETILFFATNAVALLISWACLATTHYLLGLDSQLADNISGNVVAVGLGTLFRFWVYRTWVFPEHTPATSTADTDPEVLDSHDFDADQPTSERSPALARSSSSYAPTGVGKAEPASAALGRSDLAG